MSFYRLRWAEHSVEVMGSCLIGRGEDCQVMLDDPLVSRRHAKLTVEHELLYIHDLESRNGVVVNGAKIAERQQLFGGDIITIGSHAIAVFSPGMQEPLVETEPPEPTRKLDALGVVGQLAEKALGLGHPEEAERLLSAVLEQMLREAKSGLMPQQQALEKATRLVLRLMTGTGRGVWLDWLVQLYQARRKPWPAEVVDKLYESGRSSAGYDRQGLRSYCELLRAVQGDLGPAERFQVGRIEGLERVLSAR